MGRDTRTTLFHESDRKSLVRFNNTIISQVDLKELLWLFIGKSVGRPTAPLMEIKLIVSLTISQVKDGDGLGIIF